MKWVEWDFSTNKNGAWNEIKSGERHLLAKYFKTDSTFGRFIAGLVAVKKGWAGSDNEFFMPIFSADGLGFAAAL